MAERDARIVYRDPLQILKLAKFVIGKRVGDNILVECPYHSGDANPSCSIELEKGVFHCHGCQKSGRFEEIVAQKLVGDDGKLAIEGVRRIYKDYLEQINVKTLNPDKIEVFHRALFKPENSDFVSAMAELKGLTAETLERFTVGWDGDRYTLPVYDQHRNIVNVRRRTLDKSAQQKCKNEPGYGTPARLYPFEAVQGDNDGWTVVAEGELKALLFWQLGFRGVSGTAGSGKWLPEWNIWFQGKRVAVMYDIDEVGRAAALSVARQLLPVAAEVRVCRIPLDEQQHPKGDVNDWFLLGGVTGKVIQDLIDSTPPYAYTTSETGSAVDTRLPLTPLESLDAIADPANHNKHIQVDAVIAAEETELFRVPIEWKVNCQEDQPCCAECPVSQLKKREWALDPWCRIELLKLVDVPEVSQSIELRKLTGIPRGCYANDINPTRMVNVQAIELIPDLDRKSVDRDTVISAFLVNKDMNDRRDLHGSLHTVKGFPTSDPKSGRLVLLLHDAQPAKESIDRFVLTEALQQQFMVYQPRQWTAEGIEARLQEIYDDYTSNVTHIYGRQDLHLVYDLAYHSVLSVPFNGKELKGWVEVLVIGDTGQGKSASFEALRVHYGLGDLAVGANCTGAGLLGSVQESARKRRWVYRWGKIPLNDRRLVCIEEASGMPYELIQRIRDARSSGRHEDTKAKLTRVRTRTRLVWIANPRSNRSLREYAYGITAMKELIGDNADVRRFDLGCWIANGEVDLVDFRKRVGNVKHVYNAELSQALVLWAWSRTPDQVIFDPEAVIACRDGAVAMGKRYTQTFPLVLGTEHDEKLARLAAALAARTYSTAEDTPEVVRVRACHVEAVIRLLDRLYTAPTCNYHLYSQRIAEEDAVVDNVELIKALKKVPNGAATAEFLLETAAFASKDFAYVSGLQLTDAEQLVGLMLRLRAVRPNPKQASTYTKTSGFTEMLKRISDQRDLKDTPPEKMFPEERF